MQPARVLSTRKQDIELLPMSTKPQQKQQRNFRRTQDSQTPRKSDTNSSRSNGGKWKRAFADENLSSLNQTSSPGDNLEEDDGEICIICANPRKYIALSACSHTTCHKCTFRQRALYGKKGCLICRTENEQLIFTDKFDHQFADFTPRDFAKTSEEYGIAFTSEEVYTATLQLLKYNCPFGDVADKDFESFKKYNEHLKTSHNKTICMICANNKKAFPSELKIFTPNQLRNHQSRGDSNGFKGHPMCGFCTGQRFYSDDELYVHMRDRHERCHICDQIDSTNPQYFKNYDQLFEHFRNSHYVCTVQTCLESKFVVFRDDIDLQAHILKEHRTILANDKGNIPVAGRRFQSELSTFSATPARAVHERDTFDTPALRSSSAARSANTTNSDSSPEVKRMRMEERARHYLNYSQPEFEAFLAINEDYRKNALSAEDVFTAYQKLFKSPSADVPLLIYDFSGMFPQNSAKHKDLFAIYEAEQKKNNHQINFPSLAPPSSVAAANVIGGSWGRSSSPSSASSSKSSGRYNFPALSKPVNSQPLFTPKKASFKSLNTNVRSAPVVKKASANNGTNYTPTYLQNKSTSSGSLSSSSSSSASISEEKFPPLPKAQKKKFRAPLVNEPNILNPQQWGVSSSGLRQEQQQLGSSNASTDSLSTNGKKRGKQKQKQLLFHIGI